MSAPGEHYCGSTCLDECWRLTDCDAPDVWDGAVAPGGYVCAACGIPTESEPCPQHQHARA